MRFIHLHTHSHYSDGVLSPAALVERAQTRRVGTLALTDHDTTAGLAEARAACAATGIRFVPGVELSAQWRNQTIHIVGLQVGESHAEFNANLTGVLQPTQPRTDSADRTARSASFAVAHTIRNVSGAPVLMVGINRDVTDLINAV
jgi:hypothetical protein